MSIGTTCYERDEINCEDEICLRVGCRLRNERLSSPEALRCAFRNVDALDWKHLLSFIPDSGHGRFWKAVFAEVRASLEQSGSGK